MTITLANCWSIKDCIERLARIDARATSAVDALDQLEADANMVGDDGSRCSEHQAVVDVLHDLFVLADHLVVNLKGGMALPRTPGTLRRAEAVDPIAAARPPVAPIKPRADGGNGGRSTSAKRAQLAAEARARGLVGNDEARQLTGYGAASPAVWFDHRKQGLIPEPKEKIAGMPFWSREQLQHVTYTPGHRGRVPANRNQEANAQ